MTRTPLCESPGETSDRGALAEEHTEPFFDDSGWQLEAVGRAVHDVDAGGEVYDHEDVMTYLERRLVAGPTTPRPEPSGARRWPDPIT
ncbi:MAG: hypothetical protein U1E45_04110 [Geminicoccaceae bacterium]